MKLKESGDGPIRRNILAAFSSNKGKPQKNAVTTEGLQEHIF
jgi:hypothetical protein